MCGLIVSTNVLQFCKNFSETMFPSDGSSFFVVKFSQLSAFCTCKYIGYMNDRLSTFRKGGSRSEEKMMRMLATFAYSADDADSSVIYLGASSSENFALPTWVGAGNRNKTRKKLSSFKWSFCRRSRKYSK